MFVGQFLVALCFAEMAGQFPLAGSVYQWSKQIARPVTSWMAGWIILIGAIVTVAAVAVAYQVILPQISTRSSSSAARSDVGLYSTPDGAKNAVVLALLLVVFTTIINMIGVKVMALINNVGVLIELVGATLLVIFLAFHIKRGPGVIMHTNGTGDGRTWGYIGAFLLAGTRQRLHLLRLRHRRVAGRGDEQPAQARAGRDPARDGRRVRPRRAADPVRDDGACRTSSTQGDRGDRRCRAALHRQDGARQRPRRRVPASARRSRSRCARWRCTRPASASCSRWPATAGCRSARSVARVSGKSQDADRPGAGHRRADDRAAAGQHRQPAGVPTC